MRKIIFITCLLLSLFSSAQEILPIYKNVQFIDRFEPESNTSGLVLIESRFAKSKLEDSSNLNWSDKEIVRITYLYSQNNNNPEFAQSQLSNDRYENLLTMIPQIENNDQIIWTTMVQSGCADNDCAKSLYHGFIVEFREKEKIQLLNLGHENLQTQNFKVFSTKETVLEGIDGTKLLIPEYAFVDENGSRIYGSVNIELKEAITTSSIVLGGLFTQTDKNETLESKGMIEITANKDGKEVFVAENKEIVVSVPSGFEEGYSYFQGEESEGKLVWNNPIEIDKVKDNPEMKLENRWKWGTAGFIRPFKIVDFESNNGEIETITIHLITGDAVFQKKSYSKYEGRKKGLTNRQSRVVKKWFSNNNVVQTEFYSKIFHGLFINYTLLPWSGNIPIANTEGTNTGFQDPDLVNVFSMKKLGWANIDRLSRGSNIKRIRLNIAQNSIDSLEDFSISMIVPDKNIYLPGYQKLDGLYSFTHGDYEDKVPMPIGESAYIIALGAKNNQNYFQMMPITIGDNEVEFLDLQSMDKKQSLRIIKETL